MNNPKQRGEIVAAGSSQIAPAYVKAIAQTASHYQTMVVFVSAQMQRDIDYGIIPGTKKPTLLKPGSEKQDLEGMGGAE
jgi:hypothetical protein